MLVPPNAHPLNWYPHEITGAVELLEVYVDDIEAQVKKGISDFKTNAELVVVEPGYEDDRGRVITVHKGLDDETWHLESVFDEYFPSLQRRSALITIYSFFEFELDKLCSRVKTHENFKLDVSDLGGKGILRSTTYLLKVAQLDGIRASAELNEIRNIQSIRNLLVHADGKLRWNGDGGAAKVADYIVKSKFLRGEAEIEMQHGYLAHCLGMFNVSFGQLHAALRRKYEA
jgi:hypothetical protein